MNLPDRVPQRFILIDDDPVNNMICKLTIEMVTKTIEIKTFTNGMDGFAYIQKTYDAGHDQTPAVLLLDINMPVMTGWEFLDRFDRIDPAYRKLIDIYILSSSVDERDRKRSYANKNVRDYLVKPLVNDVVSQIVIR